MPAPQRGRRDLFHQYGRVPQVLSRQDAGAPLRTRDLFHQGDMDVLHSFGACRDAGAPSEDA
jgi:hypothetical protein